MLGRLFWLGLNQKLTREANLLRVVHCHVEELRQLIQFAFHIGVGKTLIAFTTAPEDIILATKLLRDFQSLLDLSCCISKHFHIA